MERICVEKDLVIVGGGIPGIVQAIMAARLGLSVALVQNRGYLGGNASAEIGIHISGATGTQEFNSFARETGIIEELILENLYRNPDGNRYIWDGVLLDAVGKEKNIELFLNTYVDGVSMDGGTIICAYGSQNTTGKMYAFRAPLFADDTGDGHLGFLAGAEYRYGREGKQEFSETLAPDEADDFVIPSTLTFFGKKQDHPVPYIKPSFALDVPATGVLEHRIIPQEDFHRFMWYYEIDGDLDQIQDAETILSHHKELVYGIWDYIKNSGKYPAENYDLEYVAPIMGKRESRRLVGDYILTENDIKNQWDFPDVVGHGGWSVDLHAIRGFYATEPINRHVYLKGIYQIPYRCGYSKNIQNLFMEGRCMSTSHVAFGSTRVIATLSTLAQANGVAAYLCKKYHTTPRGVYESHLSELQQILLRHDQFVVGKAYEEDSNLAKNATVSVSSVAPLAICEKEGERASDTDLALSFPAEKNIESVSLLLQSKEATELTYELYLPSKPENYNPAHLLLKGSLSIPKTEGFTWVTLPVQKTLPYSCHVFMVIKKTEGVSFATSSCYLPGVSCRHFYKHTGEHNVNMDIETAERKDTWWGKMEENLCFSVHGDRVYKGENILNEYNRPYGSVNIWQTEQAEGAFIDVTLKKKEKLSTLVLFFDSELDRFFSTTSGCPQNKICNLVKDYNVYSIHNTGEKTLVASVRENHHRMNRLDITGTETDRLIIEILSAWGGAGAGMYGLRLYGEGETI